MILIYTGNVLGQKNKKLSIDSITIDMKKSEGLITTYLKNDKLYFELDKTVLEKEPLEQAASMKELMAYKHEGFWQCMDHKLDKDLLDEMCKSGNAPWLKKV